MVNRFLKGTLVLTIAGFVVKAIGSVNWILLSRVLGGEGIGIYQMAFPIYLLALQVSSAGIPVAISILTAEKLAKLDYQGAKKVFNVSFVILCITGLLASIVIYFGAPLLIEKRFIIEPRAYYSLIALSPAIFFVTLISCYRGYLQGWQMMMPTAMSQVVEQVVRVVIMLTAANLLMPYGLGAAAGGASLGAGFGAFFALLVLLYYYKKLPKESEFLKAKAEEAPEFERPTDSVKNHTLPVMEGKEYELTTSTLMLNYKEENSVRQILTRLIYLAIPISLASILLPLVANLDLLIVPRRLLVAGFTGPESTELFGYLTGMAVPLINLATIFTASLAMSLVPSISSLLSKKDKQGVFFRTAGSMRLTFLGTVPFCVMLFVLAEPVVSFIYNAPKAARATEILAIAIVFLGVHQVSTGILQGLGKPKIPVYNMFLSAGMKVILNWTLTAIPFLGIAGAAYATIVDIGLAALLNLFFIKKYTGYFLDIPTVLRNIASAIPMGVIMYFVNQWLVQHINMYVSMIVTALLGAIIYIVLMIIFKGLTRRDAEKIPFIKRFI